MRWFRFAPRNTVGILSTYMYMKNIFKYETQRLVWRKKSIFHIPWEQLCFKTFQSMIYHPWRVYLWLWNSLPINNDCVKPFVEFFFFTLLNLYAFKIHFNSMHMLQTWLIIFLLFILHLDMRIMIFVMCGSRGEENLEINSHSKVIENRPKSPPNS